MSCPAVEPHAPAPDLELSAAVERVRCRTALRSRPARTALLQAVDTSLRLIHRMLATLA